MPISIEKLKTIATFPLDTIAISAICDENRQIGKVDHTDIKAFAASNKGLHPFVCSGIKDDDNHIPQSKFVSLIDKLVSYSHTVYGEPMTLPSVITNGQMYQVKNHHPLQQLNKQVNEYLASKAKGYLLITAQAFAGKSDWAYSAINQSLKKYPNITQPPRIDGYAFARRFASSSNSLSSTDYFNEAKILQSLIVYARRSRGVAASMNDDGTRNTKLHDQLTYDMLNDQKDLYTRFRHELNHIAQSATKENPLVLLLDSADELWGLSEGSKNIRNMFPDLLPSENDLPDHTYFIITSRPGSHLTNMIETVGGGVIELNIQTNKALQLDVDSYFNRLLENPKTTRAAKRLQAFDYKDEFTSAQKELLADENLRKNILTASEGSFGYIPYLIQYLLEQEKSGRDDIITAWRDDLQSLPAGIYAIRARELIGLYSKVEHSYPDVYEAFVYALAGLSVAKAPLSASDLAYLFFTETSSSKQRLNRKELVKALSLSSVCFGGNSADGDVPLVFNHKMMGELTYTFAMNENWTVDLNQRAEALVTVTLDKFDEQQQETLEERGVLAIIHNRLSMPLIKRVIPDLQDVHPKPIPVYKQGYLKYVTLWGVYHYLVGQSLLSQEKQDKKTLQQVLFLLHNAGFLQCLVRTADVNDFKIILRDTFYYLNHFSEINDFRRLHWRIKNQLTQWHEPLNKEQTSVGGLLWGLNGAMELASTFADDWKASIDIKSIITQDAGYLQDVDRIFDGFNTYAVTDDGKWLITSGIGDTAIWNLDNNFEQVLSIKNLPLQDIHTYVNKKQLHIVGKKNQKAQDKHPLSFLQIDLDYFNYHITNLFDVDEQSKNSVCLTIKKMVVSNKVILCVLLNQNNQLTLFLIDFATGFYLKKIVLYGEICINNHLFDINDGWLQVLCQNTSSFYCSYLNIERILTVSAKQLDTNMDHIIIKGKKFKDVFFDKNHQLHTNKVTGDLYIVGQFRRDYPFKDYRHYFSLTTINPNLNKKLLFCDVFSSKSIFFGSHVECCDDYKFVVNDELSLFFMIANIRKKYFYEPDFKYILRGYIINHALKVKSKVLRKIEDYRLDIFKPLSVNVNNVEYLYDSYGRIKKVRWFFKKKSKKYNVSYYSNALVENPIYLDMDFIDKKELVFYIDDNNIGYTILVKNTKKYSFKEKVSNIINHLKNKFYIVLYEIKADINSFKGIKYIKKSFTTNKLELLVLPDDFFYLVYKSDGSINVLRVNEQFFLNKDVDSIQVFQGKHSALQINTNGNKFVHATNEKLISYVSDEKTINPIYNSRFIDFVNNEKNPKKTVICFIDEGYFYLTRLYKQGFFSFTILNDKGIFYWNFSLEVIFKFCKFYDENPVFKIIKIDSKYNIIYIETHDFIGFYFIDLIRLTCLSNKKTKFKLNNLSKVYYTSCFSSSFWSDFLLIIILAFSSLSLICIPLEVGFDLISDHYNYQYNGDVSPPPTGFRLKTLIVYDFFWHYFWQYKLYILGGVAFLLFSIRSNILVNNEVFLRNIEKVKSDTIDASQDIIIDLSFIDDMNHSIPQQDKNVIKLDKDSEGNAIDGVIIEKPNGYNQEIKTNIYDDNDNIISLSQAPSEIKLHSGANHINISVKNDKFIVPHDIVNFHAKDVIFDAYDNVIVAGDFGDKSISKMFKIINNHPVD